MSKIELLAFFCVVILATLLLLDLLFSLKEERFPKQVEQALQEYKDLCLEGCLVISCQKCRHLRKLDSGMYTCKRERLARFLVPYYRKEMDKIDEWVREQRKGVK